MNDPENRNMKNTEVQRSIFPITCNESTTSLANVGFRQLPSETMLIRVRSALYRRLLNKINQH